MARDAADGAIRATAFKWKVYRCLLLNMINM